MRARRALPPRPSAPIRSGGRIAVAAALGPLLLLGGCGKVGPDFRRPEPRLPESWSAHGETGVATSSAPDPAWWKGFGDPALDRLIQLAQQENLTLQIAGLRILEARARLGVATGRQWPQAQAVAGSVTATRLSENSSFVNGNQAPTGAIGGSEFVDYQAGFDAIWELDFWGKYRRGVEAETAGLLASAADYSDALVTLTAEVARTYTAIRTWQVLIAQAEDNERIQREGLAIAESRFANGATSEVDVAQATVLLETTRASIPRLQTALQQARNALSTLLGRPSGALDDLLAGPAAIPRPPTSIAIGMPAELLRRRSDVRSAELSAAAQCARIGIAKADFFPSIALFGTVGLQATSGNGFSFTPAESLFYAVGPRVRVPFFDYGRIKNGVRVEDARFEQTLVAYRDTVLRAAQEVEDGLTGFLDAQRAALAEERAVTAAQRSVQLAVVQYREGSADYSRVLDSERTLLERQNSLAQTRQAVVSYLIAVYKALGGGWEAHQDQPVLPAAVQDQMRQRTDWGDMLSQPGSPDRREAPEASRQE